MNKFSKCFFLSAAIILLPLDKALSQTASGVLNYQQITALTDTSKKYAIPFELVFESGRSLSKPIGTIRKLNAADTTKIFVPKNFTPETKGRLVYMDFQDKRMISRQKADMETVLVDDKLQPIAWKIGSESRTFGKLRCQKATAKVRGRNYTAWFAPSIPSRAGPWKLHGLPGLIVDAYDDKGHVHFQFERITLSNTRQSIEPPPAYGQKTMDEEKFLAYRLELIDKFHKFLNSQPGSEDKNNRVWSTEIELYDPK